MRIKGREQRRIDRLATAWVDEMGGGWSLYGDAWIRDRRRRNAQARAMRIVARRAARRARKARSARATGAGQRTEANTWRTVANAQTKAIAAFNSALGLNPNTLVGPGEDALSRLRAIVALLRESRREHESFCYPNSKVAPGCDCGADTWNARVDAALKGIL